MKQNAIENPFVDGLKKNVGREIIVVMYAGQEIVELKGICEGVDYNQKAIIIRDAENTYTIPRYLYIKRPRRMPEKK